LGNNLGIMKGMIYKITNKINGKVYIGQTIRRLEDRWASHVYEAIIGKSDNKFARAIRKHGPSSFEIVVLEKTEDLNEM
jgi:group I intron endonuclease